MRLNAAGARRPVDVCVEVGMAGGRTGCRDDDSVDEVARAAAAVPRLRLVGVAGYEAALGHDVGPRRSPASRAYLCGGARGRGAAGAAVRDRSASIVTAGGSTYFDAVAEVLRGPGDWRTDPAQRLLSHPRRRAVPRTSPPARSRLRPALQVWAQVVSRPEHGPGAADDGPARRVVRPGHAGAATGWSRQRVSSSSTINTRI